MEVPTNTPTKFQTFQQDLLGVREPCLVVVDCNGMPEENEKWQISQTVVEAVTTNNAKLLIFNETENIELKAKVNLCFANHEQAYLETSLEYQFWALLGLLIGNPQGQLIIFTNQPCKFQPIRQNKERFKVFPLSQLESFNMLIARDEWRNFHNGGELLSQFEQRQLQELFKKFLKQVLTTKNILSLEKLLNLCQNLVRGHMNNLRHQQSMIKVDMLFQLVKHLFLEDILDNKMIKSLILNNKIQSTQDFQDLSQLQFSAQFKVTIEKFQENMQKKQQESEKVIQEVV